MEALNVVPQLFFDAIGRVVPGAIATILYFYFFDSGWTLWKNFIDGVLGGRMNKEYPIGFVCFSLLLCAYVIAHLISPFTKLIQRIGEHFPPSLPPSDSHRYNWLRMHKPESGNLCAKLRAEFTMYNGMSAVFLSFAVALALTKRPLPWVETVLLGALAFLMIYRGRTTRKTFADEISHFYEVAKELSPQP